MTMFLKELKS